MRIRLLLLDLADSKLKLDDVRELISRINLAAEDEELRLRQLIGKQVDRSLGKVIESSIKNRK